MFNIQQLFFCKSTHKSRYISSLSSENKSHIRECFSRFRGYVKVQDKIQAKISGHPEFFSSKYPLTPKFFHRKYPATPKFVHINRRIFSVFVYVACSAACRFYEHHPPFSGSFRDARKRDSLSIFSREISSMEKLKLCSTGISAARPDIFITSTKKLCCKALEIFTNNVVSKLWRAKILYTLVRSQCIRLANSATVSPLSSKTAFTKCPI